MRWLQERGVTPTTVAPFSGDMSIRAFADKVHNVVRWTELDNSLD